MKNNDRLVRSSTDVNEMSSYLDNQAYLPFVSGGSINLHNGELKYEFVDTKIGGVAFPFELRHLFNKWKTIDNYYGEFWNLSVNRRMWYYTESSGIPFYENEYGETVYFVESDEPNVYVDVCDLDMKFYSYTEDGIMLSDKFGNKMYFDDGGWLVKLVDVNENYIVIERTGDRPTKIIDSFGRETLLTYTNGLLSSVTDFSGRTVAYEYDSSKNLIRVSWSDESEIKLMYAVMGDPDVHISNRKTFEGLVEIINQDETKTVFIYEEDSENKSFGRVIRIERFPAESDIETDICEDYTDISYVPKRTPYNSNVLIDFPGNATVTYKSGISKVVYFDLNGRPTFSYESKPWVENGIVSDVRKQVIKSVAYEYENRRRKHISSVLQDDDSVNLLIDGSFEEYTTTEPTWETSGLTSLDGIISTDSVDEGKCFEFSNQKLNGSYNKKISQTVDGTKIQNIKGDYLILSGWGKFPQSGGDIRPRLNAVVTYTDNSSETFMRQFTLRNNTWYYEELPIKLSKDKIVDNIKVTISSTDQSPCRFDNIKLVNSPLRYSERGNKYSVEQDEDVTHILSQFTGDFVDARVTVFGKTMTIDETIDSFDGINKNQLITNTNHDVVREKITDADGNCFCNYYEYDDKHQLIYSQNYRGIITKYTYNSVGMVTSVKTWYEAEINPSTITEPSQYFLKTMEYDETGEFLIRENDPRGDYIYTVNQYDTTKCLLTSTTSPNGQQTSYTYDPNNDLVTKVSSLVGENEYSVLYGYTNRRLTSITHNGFDYGFTYDGMGRAKDVKIADETYSSNDYLLTDTTTVTTTYATGEKMKVETDRFNQPIKTTYIDADGNSEILLETEYDSLGRVTKAIDKAELMTYNYKYDGFGNVINSSGGNLRVTNTFDSSNRLAEKLMEYGGEDFVITPTYEKDLDGKIYPDNLINGFSYDNGVTTQTKRDEYGRVTEKQVDFDENSNVITENYRYLKVPNDTSYLLANMVRSITYNHGGEEETIQYTYDNNGNITAVTKGFDVLVRYEYDEMNQLVREDNKQLNRSFVYRYDNAGNIILKDEHEYIYGEETATLARKEYTYSDTGWKDKLISFDGQSITYDALGNPLNYLGHNLTWDRVRQLKTFDNNTFAYDGFGKRCRKNSVYYLYDGDKLIKERRNGTSLVYFYDTTGICGFRYNIFTGGVNSTDYYFYRKNLQGDVTAILDENGIVVAEYLYDAWGKCYITYDPISIGAINSIRYRSYYYDTETGFYYLKSRYYDPNTGRFINADVYVSTGKDVMCNNMFSYCYNNPINMLDPNGKDAIWLQYPDNADGFGHTGLLIQNQSGIWYFFYWGAKSTADKVALVVGTESFHKFENVGVGNVDSLERIFTLLNMSSFEDAATGLESYLYMEGDFSAASGYLESLEDTKYYLLTKNCVQTSINALLLGTFKYNDTKNKSELRKIFDVVPNNVYSKWKSKYQPIFVLPRANGYDRIGRTSAYIN